MAATAAEKLYTPAILALAVELADYPFTSEFGMQGDARSKSCGSTVAVSIAADRDRKIGDLGMSVKACAIGQAAAAIFARSAKGKTRRELELELDQLEGWLHGHGAMPQVDRIELLDRARSYSARHDAILLPWKAAIGALSNDPAPR